MKVTVDIPRVGALVFTGDHPDAMAETILALAEGKLKQESKVAKWGPITGAANMEKLCALFPTLRGVYGTAPWNADRLDREEFFHEAPVYAARFVLHVWNAHHEWKMGKFDLFTAWSHWDDAHRAAAMAWLQDPFYP